MNHRNAGGRNTQSVQIFAPSCGMERHIKDQLAAMTEAIKVAFARANALTRDVDEYGHGRSGEVANAVSLAKTSAKLLLAVGKMRGEFHHNINVRRLEAEPETVERIGDTERLFTHEELEALTPEEIRTQIPIRRSERAAARGRPPSEIGGSNA